MVLFFIGTPIGQKRTLVSVNLLLLFLLINNVINYPEIRLTSLLYTVIYLIEFTVLFNFIQNYKPKQLLKVLSFILYAYTLNIIIGFGFVTLNILPPAGLDLFIKVVQNEAGARAAGFSSEPSYAAFVISATTLAIGHLSKHKLNRKNIFVLCAYILSTLLLGSAYGLLLMLVVLFDWGLPYLKRMPHYFKIITCSIILLIGVLGITQLNTNTIKNKSVERIIASSKTLSTNNSIDKKLEKLRATEPSLFARLGTPYILFTKGIDSFSNLIIGRGAGAAGVYIPQLLEGYLINEGDDEFDTGILPAFVFDYGLIGSFLLLLILISCMRKLSIACWLLLILILPNANINTQVFWYLVIVFLIISISKTHTIHALPSSNLTKITTR